MKARGLDALCLLILAALCGLFFHAILGFQQVWYSLDFYPYVIPYFHWLHQKYAAGLAPTWNQLNFFGYPFFDESLSGYFYPPQRIILTYFDGIEALGILTALHVFFAGAGAFVFARRLGLASGLALLAAVVTAFGGGMVYSFHSIWNVVSLSWLPWQFLALSLCMDEAPKRRWAGWVLLGISAGLAVTGGHLMMTFYGLCLTLPYLISLLKGRWAAGLKRLGPGLLTAGLIAGLLCQAQLRATRRMTLQSQRSQSFTYEYAQNGSVSPASLITPVLPFAFGHTIDNSFLGPVWPLGTDDHQALYLYVGVLALALAWMAFLSGDARVRPFAWAFGILVLYALGKWTPFHRLLFHLPLFGHFRGPTRAATLSAFPLGVAAAFGMERLLAGKVNAARWSRLALGLGIAFALGSVVVAKTEAYVLKLAHPKIEARAASTASGHGVAYYEEKLQRWQGRLERNLLEQALALGACALMLLWLVKPGRSPWQAGLVAALFCFGELYYYGSGYFPTIPRDLYTSRPWSVQQLKGEGRVFGWGWVDMLQRAYPNGFNAQDQKGEYLMRELLTNNGSLLWGVPNVRGYSPLTPSRYEKYFEGLDDFKPGSAMDEATRKLEARSRLLDIASVQYVLSSRDLKAPGLRKLGQGPVIVYQNDHALPLAWLADAVTVMTDPALGRGHAVSLEEGEPRKLSGKGSIRWLAQTDERWAMDIESAEDGLLFLSRSYYEGLWHATVDGAASRILPANGAFCAIWLKGGRHQVVLSL